MQVGIEIDVLRQLPAILFQGLGPAQTDILVRPAAPACHIKMLFDSHIEGVAVQPRVFLAEGFHLLAVPLPARHERLAQNLETGDIDLAIVHIPGAASPAICVQLLQVQQAVLCQQLQVDEVRVARKGGK